MINTYTGINFSHKISTTQKLFEATPLELGDGFLFVGVNSTNGWAVASTDNRAMGVAGQIWRDNGGITADICTLGDGVFVRVEEGAEALLNKRAYCTPAGLLTSDEAFADAVELNAFITEIDVNLILPDGTSVNGARIGFNSAL